MVYCSSRGGGNPRGELDTLPCARRRYSDHLCVYNDGVEFPDRVYARKVRMDDATPLRHGNTVSVIARAKKNGGPGFVYFVQGRKGGAVKIGYAVNPQRRLGNMSTGSPVPLRLLAAIPGDRKLEFDLHRFFGVGRLHGEWFQAKTFGLFNLIGAVREEFPLG
jgi:hypothetical protein